MPSDYEAIVKENLKRYGEDTWYADLLAGLYEEKTHFIFELLQNAEDVHATRIRFDLFDDRLELRHDGQPFEDRHVRGICGIGKSTKPGDLTQIGKFGIGFKSIYAFTKRPEIHSGEYHFAIEQFIRPVAIPARTLEHPNWTTLFILPFDRDDLDAERSFDEIGKRLASLACETLLFVNHIREIEWDIHDLARGCYLRQEAEFGPARRVTLIGECSGDDDKETEWLVFRSPIDDDLVACERKVEIAFRLAHSNGRLSIVPADTSPLYVFFPTARATGLGLLIQGPFRTTPARDNVPKDEPWNRKLIEVAGRLVCDAVIALRELKLLTVGVLESLPIRPAEFPDDSMFRPIFDAVAKRCAVERMLPTESGAFATSLHAKLSRSAEVRRLFNGDVLTELLGLEQASAAEWIVGDITYDRTRPLYDYLEKTLGIEELTPEKIARKLTARFLANRDDEWMRQFYSFLAGQEALWRQSRWSGDAGGPARILPIIRLENNSQVAPFKADGSPAVYLSAPEQGSDIPLVKRTLASIEAVDKFMVRLGLGPFDEVAYLRERLVPKYADSSGPVPFEVNLADLTTVYQLMKASLVSPGVK